RLQLLGGGRGGDAGAPQQGGGDPRLPGGGGGQGGPGAGVGGGGPLRPPPGGGERPPRPLGAVCSVFSVSPLFALEAADRTAPRRFRAPARESGSPAPAPRRSAGHLPSGGGGSGAPPARDGPAPGWRRPGPTGPAAPRPGRATPSAARGRPPAAGRPG